MAIALGPRSQDGKKRRLPSCSSASWMAVAITLSAGSSVVSCFHEAIGLVLFSLLAAVLRLMNHPLLVMRAPVVSGPYPVDCCILFVWFAFLWGLSLPLWFFSCFESFNLSLDLLFASVAALLCCQLCL